MNCKTGAYGANVSICGDCGTVQIHYNSCRNRCCPMCQAVPKEMWMDARRKMYLTPLTFISYLQFRISSIRSFTVIRSGCMIPCITPLLLQSVNWRLTQKHLGASAEYICILHTWGSEMNFHPHIHTILLGGGLTQKMNGRITALNFSFQSRSFPKYSVENTWKN